MRAEAQVISPTTLPNLDHLLSLSSLIGNKLSDDAHSLPLPVLPFLPTIRSGSFSEIGPRSHMEDEHVTIDDLSMHLGTLFTCPNPTSFYAVFDGHGGSEASAYVKQNVTRLFFEDSGFLHSAQLEDNFLQELENCFRRAFLLADLALADDPAISSFSGTTALAALVVGRLLLVANAGDCRAVLCRKGEAIDMSQDHKPTCPSEKRRVEESGGFVEDGYLNGALAVSRALGDWHMKLPKGSTSPLIAEPELRQRILTEDDEFLIIACDGIWDVMSSQQAVSLVRRGLRRQLHPKQCAKDLVREALRLNTFDNLTVVVVCFSSPDYEQEEATVGRLRRVRCSILSEALTNVQNLMDLNAHR